MSLSTGRTFADLFGLTREIPEQRQRAVLDFLAGRSSKAVVPATRKADLRFEATDLEWSAGEGDLVSGPAEALMMALAGRPVAWPTSPATESRPSPRGSRPPDDFGCVGPCGSDTEAPDVADVAGDVAS